MSIYLYLDLRKELAFSREFRIKWGGLIFPTCRENETIFVVFFDISNFFDSLLNLLNYINDRMTPRYAISFFPYRCEISD